MSPNRHDRVEGRSEGKTDSRQPFQIDRDRILYSMAFRRLAGVTQVVSPGEGEIFHNRLTHSIKVGQIARRFAESLSKDFPEVVQRWGGLDPEVVEAAALAHDLGHPPFGHIAERELDYLVAAELHGGADKLKDIPKDERLEGFEGNAQSFHIVTNLAVRHPDSIPGLNLTRATLNALLKYPWKWLENKKKMHKYGVYTCDYDAFLFARDGRPEIAKGPFVRSLEAQVMDWSDDIAYSVHDVEDFYRAGMIPLDRLASGSVARDQVIDHFAERPHLLSENGLDKNFRKKLDRLFGRIPVREPYTGTREQQQYLYQFVSSNINRFVTATRLKETPDENGDVLDIHPEIHWEVEVFKRLVWIYVIENPSMAAHQVGQRKAIRTLFFEYNDAINEKKWSVFPELYRVRARELIEDQSATGHLESPNQAAKRVRLVADTISSMTDKQALLVYQQFSGLSPSSMLDPVIR